MSLHGNKKAGLAEKWKSTACMGEKKAGWQPNVDDASEGVLSWGHDSSTDKTLRRKAGCGG